MDLDVSNDDYDTDEVSARTAAHLAASDVTKHVACVTVLQHGVCLCSAARQ